MSENENALIDTNFSDDIGDEISSRFRYQWIISAITCCLLLDQSEDVQEVFCEYHEDILVKHLDGLFTGIQIKTKASDQPLWKAGDISVISAFAKFVTLDNKYPEQFKAFKFITNHPAQSSMNGQDINFLLKKINESINYISLDNVIKNFVKRISKKANVLEEQIFFSLKKVSISHNNPKLQDATMRLIDTVSLVWDKANEVTYEGIKRASINLVDECFRASSLASQDLLPAYLPESLKGAEKEIQERITGKKFDKQRVYNVLLQGLDETIPLSCDPKYLEDIRTDNTELLRKKLTAGGFSANSIMYAEDLRNTSDYAGICLTQKYGKEQGLKKYYELRLKVQGDAAREFEKNKKDNEKFGFNMLLSLQEKLKNRFSSGEQLYGYSIEHLEGLAYSLTSQCKITWSNDRPWEVE
jgi:hypothetical protein